MISKDVLSSLQCASLPPLSQSVFVIECLCLHHYFIFYFIYNFFPTSFLHPQGNTMKLLWTYADKDPIYGHLKWHGTFSGVRPIHLLSPLWKKPNPSHNPNNRDIRQWDVTVKNVSHFQFISSIQLYCHYTFILFILWAIYGVHGTHTCIHRKNDLHFQNTCCVRNPTQIRKEKYRIQEIKEASKWGHSKMRNTKIKTYF